MDLIAANTNIIPVDNIWNNLENVHPLCTTIFVRVRSIILNRHPKVLYSSQLVWGLDFWEREEDIGNIPPIPLIVRLPDGKLVSTFTMDLTITSSDPDGLGALYHSIRNLVANNFGALGRCSKPRTFSYSDMAHHANIDGVTYLVCTSNGDNHIRSYMHQVIYELDNSGDLVLTFNGMFLSSENEGNIHIPISFNYKGIVLLYNALQELYHNTAITIKVIKNNQVIEHAYQS
jgi:hypothetical protein